MHIFSISKKKTHYTVSIKTKGLYVSYAYFLTGGVNG